MSWFDPEVGWENFKACGCWILLVGVPFLSGICIGWWMWGYPR